jgi:hypothetical protein
MFAPSTQGPQKIVISQSLADQMLCDSRVHPKQLPFKEGCWSGIQDYQSAKARAEAISGEP